MLFSMGVSPLVLCQAVPQDAAPAEDAEDATASAAEASETLETLEAVSATAEGPAEEALVLAADGANRINRVVTIMSCWSISKIIFPSLKQVGRNFLVSLFWFRLLGRNLWPHCPLFSSFPRTNRKGHQSKTHRNAVATQAPAQCQRPCQRSAPLRCRRTHNRTTHSWRTLSRRTRSWRTCIRRRNGVSCHSWLGATLPMLGSGPVKQVKGLKWPTPLSRCRRSAARRWLTRHLPQQNRRRHAMPPCFRVRQRRQQLSQRERSQRGQRQLGRRGRRGWSWHQRFGFLPWQR